MIKWLGQITGLIFCSFISPAWFLLNESLKGYFNVEKAMANPQQMMIEFINFNLLVKRYPEEVLFSLLPKLILILLGSILFTAALGYACGHIASILNKKILCRFSS